MGPFQHPVDGPLVSPLPLLGEALGVLALCAGSSWVGGPGGLSVLCQCVAGRQQCCGKLVRAVLSGPTSVFIEKIYH